MIGTPWLVDRATSIELCIRTWIRRPRISSACWTVSPVSSSAWLSTTWWWPAAMASESSVASPILTFLSVGRSSVADHDALVGLVERGQGVLVEVGRGVDHDVVEAGAQRAPGSGRPAAR